MVEPVGEAQLLEPGAGQAAARDGDGGELQRGGGGAQRGGPGGDGQQVVHGAHPQLLQQHVRLLQRAVRRAGEVQHQALAAQRLQRQRADAQAGGGGVLHDGRDVVEVHDQPRAVRRRVVAHVVGRQVHVPAVHALRRPQLARAARQQLLLAQVEGGLEEQVVLELLLLLGL